MKKPCSLCGKTAKVRKCSRCRNAFYCSTECQKTAWKKHKVECKQASSPQEYIINQSGGVKQSVDYLYSTDPAKDVLKLAENEGESWTSTLRLLLVGFCDLKDFIFTLVSLPKGFTAPLEFHMVDFNPMCIARAAILLNILQKMVMAWGEDEKKMQYASWRQSFFLIWYSTTLGQQESSILKETIGAFLNRESHQVFRELASFLDVECVGDQTGWVWCCQEYLNCEWEVDQMKDAVWNIKGRVDPADLRHGLPGISEHQDPEVFSSLERVLGSGSILPSEVQAASSSPPAAGAPAGAASVEEEDYRALSVKELKSRLSALRVNSSHCVEKQDLVDLLKASPSSSGGNLANPTPESELHTNPTMLSPYMPGKMVYAVPPGAIPFGGWPVAEVEAHGAARGLMPNILASYVSLVLAKLDAAVAALARGARAGRPAKVVLCNNDVRGLRERYPRAGDGFDRITTSTLADHVGVEAVLRYTGPLLRPGSPHAAVVMDLHKVGDFNENLSYAMQDGRGLLSVIQQARMNQGMEGAVHESSPHLLQEVARFEAALQEAVGDSSGIIEYQGSFMKTDTTIPQPPHVDFKWELLQEEKDRFFIAFFPLTDEGMFLQLWPNRCKTETTSGFIVYIPQGKLLMVPSDTVHGGGFKAGENGNLRFHLYVASGGASLPITHTNKYTEEDDPTKEMSDRLIDSSCLKELVGPFFDNY